MDKKKDSKSYIKQDLEIIGDDYSLYVNKDILLRHCKYFSNIFKDPEIIKKNKIILSDLCLMKIEYNTMIVILDFIYGNNNVISVANLIDTFEVAIYLDIDSIVEYCRNRLVKHYSCCPAQMKFIYIMDKYKTAFIKEREQIIEHMVPSIELVDYLIKIKNEKILINTVKDINTDAKLINCITKIDDKELLEHIIKNIQPSIELVDYLIKIKQEKFLINIVKHINTDAKLINCITKIDNKELLEPIIKSMRPSIELVDYLIEYNNEKLLEHRVKRMYPSIELVKRLIKIDNEELLEHCVKKMYPSIELVECLIKIGNEKLLEFVSTNYFTRIKSLDDYKLFEISRYYLLKKEMLNVKNIEIDQVLNKINSTLYNGNSCISSLQNDVMQNLHNVDKSWKLEDRVWVIMCVDNMKATGNVNTICSMYTEIINTIRKNKDSKTEQI